MSQTECAQQLVLFQVGRQEVVVDFKGEGIVSACGLVSIRQLDQRLALSAQSEARRGCSADG